MKTTLPAALAVALATVIGASQAQSQPHELVVEDAWARASIGTSRPGVVYMTLRNKGAAAVSISGFEADLAEMAEVHRTSTDDQGVTRMTPAGAIEIGAGDSVALEPGGLHVMLMGLTRPMTDGEAFTLTLRTARDDINVEVLVLGMAATGPAE